MPSRLAAAAVIIAGTLGGCSVPEPLPEAAFGPDPLIGRVFQTQGPRELTREALYARLEDRQVIYLGEKHDNPHHHELQLDVVRTLVDRGHRPAIGFEVFSREQTSLLMTYLARESTAPGPEGSPEDWLRGRLGWDSSRDDQWNAYGPLLSFAREHGLIAVGIDLPPALRLRIVRVGVAGLTNVERGLLHPTRFEDAAYESLMLERLKRHHCGHGSEAYFRRLYQTWLARNDTMAAAILGTVAQQPDEPVVVVLGAGHVQNSMGVYERVAEQRPDLRQLNLGLREVAATARPLGAYLVRPEVGGVRFAPDHEYLWFTARVDSNVGDPCAGFAKPKSS